MQLLLQSLNDEREAQQALVDEQFCHLASLEEKGAVYTVGRNDLGQCGVGIDTMKKGDKGLRVFTIIPMTRGLGVEYVTCGEDCTFAVVPGGGGVDDDDTTDSKNNHENDTNVKNNGGAVYAWAGVHIGPTGIDPDSEELHVASSNGGQGSKALHILDTPQIIPRLVGEQIIQVSVGKNHACAVSSVGDLFVWGYGKFGALGLGKQSLDYCKRPVLLTEFDENTTSMTKTNREDIRIQHVSCHSCSLTSHGTLYSWGNALGLGKYGLADVTATTEHENKSASSNSERRFVDRPSLVKFPFSNACITKVSCGSERCLAMSSQFVFSWGSGDGFRLGHGDRLDRWTPEPIMPLNPLQVLDISAAMWHSACIVATPPITDAGHVYTWVSHLL